MKLINSIQEMKSLRKNVRGTLGFVPTMGYLHEGHISLVQQSVRDNDTTAVSIYVNPTQFDPSEDFQAYPRDLERDLKLLETENTDIVFFPTNAEMYPDDYCTWVDVEKVTARLEGEIRPGHFRGVATIVTKLFNIVQPDKAYFGQKDAQQALVIKRMVKDLNMNLEVMVMPTLREKDGLAMSSRNTYLNPEERKAAIILYKALSLAKQLKEQGETATANIRNKMELLIKNEPLARIEYISITDTQTMEELPALASKSLVSMAVRIGKTRLIDNLII
jgi:pantoate--beta-alanine ligase